MDLLLSLFQVPTLQQGSSKIFLSVILQIMYKWDIILFQTKPFFLFGRKLQDIQFSANVSLCVAIGLLSQSLGLLASPSNLKCQKMCVLTTATVILGKKQMVLSSFLLTNSFSFLAIKKTQCEFVVMQCAQQFS